MTKKPSKEKPPQPQTTLPLATQATPSPDFHELLSSPLVDVPLPKGFASAREAGHLTQLWTASTSLRRYRFDRFVHAGGSGMVFKVSTPDVVGPLALKVARESLYSGGTSHPDIARSLSPVSEQELRALTQLSHAHIVRLHAALTNERGVFALVTSYVDEPKPLDEYLQYILGQHPDPEGRKGLHPFSPERLDRACAFLVERFSELTDAVCHMHEQGFYHCDLKPANVLVNADRRAILTDLGSAVRPDDADASGALRVQFTWTYAHPDLTSLVSDPRGISGGGLKASARVKVDTGLARFDLFALGRTVQETLGLLEREFGERCHACYNFRFLHIIASLLLDGRNAPLTETTRVLDGRRFIKDCALDYPPSLWLAKRLTTAAAVRERLRRFSRSYWPSEDLPELDHWQADVINTGVDAVAPFSRRVAEIFRHPAVRRLRAEPQLGWMREVYPGATHTRWSHSLGVFAAAADYYSALLADPEVPTARLLLDPVDIEHGLVAAMLHDVGQTAFGHDFEAAAPGLYRHEALIARLMGESSWGSETLGERLLRFWPRIRVDRVLAILRHSPDEGDTRGPAPLADPVDGLARDIINGPIDADKLDYLVRDSSSCRVTYGMAIDRPRFLRALTVDAKEVLGTPRLALAYRAKGSAAVEAVLLARYQLYGSVYWHHTFRCIQAMFAHAVGEAFGNLRARDIVVRGGKVRMSTLEQLFYWRVVCGHSRARCRELLKGAAVPAHFFEDVPVDLVGERAVEFVWKFAPDHVRVLLERLVRRDLFRRVFELSVGAMGQYGDYSDLARRLGSEKRVALAGRLQVKFLDAIYKKIQQRGPMDSVSESEARERHRELKEKRWPLVVLDFPTRGVPNERNFPRAIGDPARKYIAGRGAEVGPTGSVFATVRSLQVAMAAVRVFAAGELHELIVRYLVDCTGDSGTSP